MAETAPIFSRENHKQFNLSGALDDLSEESLQKAVVGFRECGTSIGAINTYVRGINLFLNWLCQEHNYENLLVLVWGYAAK